MWENRDDDKKILNALDLPNLRGNRNPTPHTSDIHAWDLTPGHHGVDQTSPYPIEHMRWSLIGHKNSLTFFHLDCGGLSTEVIITDGGKIWGILRPRSSNPLSSTGFFLNPGFRLDDMVDISEYDIECVYLRRGDRLYALTLPHPAHTDLNVDFQYYASLSASSRVRLRQQHLPWRTLLLHRPSSAVASGNDTRFCLAPIPYQRVPSYPSAIETNGVVVPHGTARESPPFYPFVYLSGHLL